MASSRRLAALLFRNRSLLSIPRESPLPFRATVTGLVRGIQTQQEAPGEDAAKDSNETPQSLSPSPNANAAFTASSTLKTSARHDLAMVFTCRVCETRSVKTVCRESYEKGVVVVRCGGCNNLHLIADRRGWFGQPGSVEDFLAARGEDVIKGSADTLNLTLEDLAGTRSPSS